MYYYKNILPLFAKRDAKPIGHNPRAGHYTYLQNPQRKTLLHCVNQPGGGAKFRCRRLFPAQPQSLDHWPNVFLCATFRPVSLVFRSRSLSVCVRRMDDAVCVLRPPRRHRTNTITSDKHTHARHARHTRQPSACVRVRVPPNCRGPH